MSNVIKLTAKTSLSGFYSVILGSLTLAFALHVEAANKANIYVYQNSATKGFSTEGVEGSVLTEHTSHEISAPTVWAPTDNFLNQKTVDVQYGVLLGVYIQVCSTSPFDLYVKTDDSISDLHAFCDSVTAITQ